MSNLSLLNEAGFNSKVTEALDVYVKDSSDVETKSVLSEVIDKHGLRGNEVIRCIDNLHRTDKVRPGLYGFLGQVNDSYRTTTGKELPANSKKMTRPKVQEKSS